MKWYQTLAVWIIAVVLSFGVGFLACWFVKNCAKDIIEIYLTGSEKQQIIQDARLGWITLDSAKALIISESKIEWIPRDSIVFDYRDSIIYDIRDSIVYIPVYVARDTIINFYDTSKTAIVSLAIRLKQRFFPLQERFASDLKLMSLTVELPEQKVVTGGWFSNFFEHRFIIYGGVGINYGNGKFDTGFQIGAGIRIL